MITLRVLGTADLAGSDPERSRALLAQSKSLALLVYLAMSEPATFHRRDRLVGLLWPELDQEHARGQLRKALTALRGALGAEALLRRGDEEVALAPGAVACDAVELEQRFAAGQHARVVELYRRGDLLPGFFVPEAHEFEDWLDRKRADLRDRAAAAAWAYAYRAAREGEQTAATSHARRAAEWAPTDERMLRRVVELLAFDLHNAAAALALADDFERRLKRDFGGELSDLTRELLRRVREAGDDARSRARPPA